MDTLTGRFVVVCYRRHPNEEGLGASDRASDGEGDIVTSLTQNPEYVFVHARSNTTGCSIELPKNLYPKPHLLKEPESGNLTTYYSA